MYDKRIVKKTKIDRTYLGEHMPECIKSERIQQELLIIEIKYVYLLKMYF